MHDFWRDIITDYCIPPQCRTHTTKRLPRRMSKRRIRSPRKPPKSLRKSDKIDTIVTPYNIVKFRENDIINNVAYNDTGHIMALLYM